MTVTDELEWTRKEAVVVYFKVLSLNMHGGIEEVPKNSE
jgi:hypothetical protein